MECKPGNHSAGGLRARSLGHRHREEVRGASWSGGVEGRKRCRLAWHCRVPRKRRREGLRHLTEGRPLMRALPNKRPDEDATGIVRKDWDVRKGRQAWS